LASLTKIFNNISGILQPGNLVLIKTSNIIQNYMFNFSNQSYYTIGLILCEDTSKEDVHPRIYYKKMYKVYLHGTIISILHTDIEERL